MKEYLLPQHPVTDWIRDGMRLGPSLALARHLESTLDWTQFAFRTVAFEDLTPSQLSNFTSGNRADSDQANNWVFDTLVRSSLSAGSMYLVEDWRASRSSNFIRQMSLPAIFCGDEVYYAVRERDPRHRDHWRRIFSNTVPTFYAFLVADDPRLAVGESISFDALRDSARDLRALISGAFDGESYILATQGDLLSL
jgi:hypothetical protein